MHHPTDKITHTTAFVTPVVEHWLDREIAQWVHHEGSIRRPIAPSTAWNLTRVKPGLVDCVGPAHSLLTITQSVFFNEYQVTTCIK